MTQKEDKIYNLLDQAINLVNSMLNKGVDKYEEAPWEYKYAPPVKSKFKKSVTVTGKEE